MTYKELYEKAIRMLEHNEINGKEYDKMIEPLNAEIVIRCKNCKWWNADTCMEWYDTPYTPPYGFCHKGERK